MDFNEEGMGDGIRFQLLPHLEYFRFSSLEETRFCLNAATEPACRHFRANHLDVI